RCCTKCSPHTRRLGATRLMRLSPPFSPANRISACCLEILTHAFKNCCRDALRRIQSVAGKHPATCESSWKRLRGNRGLKQLSHNRAREHFLCGSKRFHC